jgi:single-strand DNA-binding protein
MSRTSTSVTGGPVARATSTHGGAGRSAPAAPADARPTPLGTNVVVLHGVLARDPDARALPSGDELVAYEVTVPRPDGPAEGVPVVRFGAPSSASRLVAGDAVVVVGRVRRRFFRAGGATQSRTEVVAERVSAARTPARARTLLAKALATAVQAVDRPAG